MRRPKKSQRYDPPKVGDYIARQEPFKTGGYVALKTDVLSELRMFACVTMEGARRLARLMNDARDLAVCWRDVRTDPLFMNGNAEADARDLIAHAACKALGVEVAHDFGRALIKEAC